MFFSLKNKLIHVNIQTQPKNVVHLVSSHASFTSMISPNLPHKNLELCSLLA